MPTLSKMKNTSQRIGVVMTVWLVVVVVYKL